MTTIKTSKLHPLYIPAIRFCCTCQRAQVASAVQIVSGQNWNRHRYFCSDCSTERGLPPSQDLLSRIKDIDKLEKG
jgi:hypothetical protein